MTTRRTFALGASLAAAGLIAAPAVAQTQTLKWRMVTSWPKRLPGPGMSAERVALNFLQRLSGVASLTARYVDAVKGTGAKILDTRKTTPGWRRLEKYAVRAGGGLNHRMDLSAAVLIKDNHLAALGGDVGRRTSTIKVRQGNSGSSRVRAGPGDDGVRV